MTKCLYCDRDNKPEHFICDVCGDGMCEECYNEEKEHELHYQMPECLTVTDDEYELLLKTFHSGYACEKCLNETLKKLKGRNDGLQIL